MPRTKEVSQRVLRDLQYISLWLSLKKKRELLFNRLDPITSYSLGYKEQDEAHGSIEDTSEGRAVLTNTRLFIAEHCNSLMMIIHFQLMSVQTIIFFSGFISHCVVLFILPEESILLCSLNYWNSNICLNFSFFLIKNHRGNKDSFFLFSLDYSRLIFTTCLAPLSSWNNMFGLIKRRNLMSVLSCPGRQVKASVKC